MVWCSMCVKRGLFVLLGGTVECLLVLLEYILFRGNHMCIVNFRIN